eukprot:CAMPEP_0119487990 /NCGR_PEP_ID=MMETSP1344-20130328/13905_1 /TAXON_ID=236787 /ORGANISM="Florenciella parvula, Strain CCMP2471" /LENGTH=34 /DNA_ID= /DNA_START= /DNA_END= /DNA_ORIENTATION=
MARGTTNPALHICNCQLHQAMGSCWRRIGGGGAE